MPLLLRRAAPSPSVDELSFSTPPSSLTSKLSESSMSGSQRCMIHGTSLSRSSSGGNRRSSETEISSSEERDSREDLATTAAAAAAEVDAERSSGLTSQSSFCCTCPPPARSRASQGSSKRLSTRLEDLAATVVEDGIDQDANDIDDTESYCSHESELTCHKCEAISVRDSVSSSASSRIVIRDTQLAALDVELQNLRKTFVKSVYQRLTTMSRKLGKRGGTQQITAN